MVKHQCLPWNTTTISILRVYRKVPKKLIWAWAYYLSERLRMRGNVSCHDDIPREIRLKQGICHWPVSQCHTSTLMHQTTTFTWAQPNQLSWTNIQLTHPSMKIKTVSVWLLPLFSLTAKIQMAFDKHRKTFIPWSPKLDIWPQKHKTST